MSRVYTCKCNIALCVLECGYNVWFLSCSCCFCCCCFRRAVIYCSEIINYFVCVFAECTSIRGIQQEKNKKTIIRGIKWRIFLSKSPVFQFVSAGANTMAYSPNCYTVDNAMIIKISVFHYIFRPFYSLRTTIYHRFFLSSFTKYYFFFLDDLRQISSTLCVLVCNFVHQFSSSLHADAVIFYFIFISFMCSYDTHFVKKMNAAHIVRLSV